MSQMLKSVGSTLKRVRNKTKRVIKPRPVHRIQLSHPHRFNAYKVAGYSFGALTAIIIGPIVLWPIADVWLLPKVISHTLSTTPSGQDKEQCDHIWGRDYEMKQMEYMLQSLPNNIWILNGTTNSGKTTFIKKLLSLHKGIIYVDLRHFFDGNAFVFEMVDSLYPSMHSHWIINKLVGCYVKLFVFVTTIIAQSDQHVTAMLYFHALLNHLKAGIRKYDQQLQNAEPKQYPLIIFDHFEALSSALQHTKVSKQSKNREMLSFIMYSISQFSSSICHDACLSHVLFVGNDLFTKHGVHDEAEEPMSYFSSSVLKQCEYWNMDGVNTHIARDHVVKELENTLDISSKEQMDVVQECAEKLVGCIGTKPYDITVALKGITSNITGDGDESITMQRLNTNVINYTNHIHKSRRARGNDPDINVNKLQRWNESGTVMEWDEALIEWFDGDQELMTKLIDDNVLSQRHGSTFASTAEELLKMKLLGTDDNVYVEPILSRMFDGT
eukprot:844953_1